MYIRDIGQRKEQFTLITESGNCFPVHFPLKSLRLLQTDGGRELGCGGGCCGNLLRNGGRLVSSQGGSYLPELFELRFQLGELTFLRIVGCISLTQQLILLTQQFSTTFLA